MIITPKMSINSDSKSLKVSEEMKQLLQEILETEPLLLRVDNGQAGHTPGRGGENEARQGDWLKSIVSQR